MQIWLEVEEFSKLTHLDIPTSKISHQSVDSGVVTLPGDDFIEKTMGTILSLHEKVMDAKDETLDALKSENCTQKT